MTVTFGSGIRSTEQILNTHVYLSARNAEYGGFRSAKYARLEMTRRLTYSPGDIARTNHEANIGLLLASAVMFLGADGYALDTFDTTKFTARSAEHVRLHSRGPTTSILA